MDRLPNKPALRDAAERLLIEQARDHDASDLAHRGRYLLERLDPDGTEKRDEQARDREECSAHLGRFLSLSEDGLGGVRIKGRGTVEDAAAIKAALFPLAAPQSTEAGACGGNPTDPTDRAGLCGIDGCAHDGKDPREHGTRLWGRPGRGLLSAHRRRRAA